MNYKVLNLPNSILVQGNLISYTRPTQETLKWITYLPNMLDNLISLSLFRSSFHSYILLQLHPTCISVLEDELQTIFDIVRMAIEKSKRCPLQLNFTSGNKRKPQGMKSTLYGCRAMFLEPDVGQYWTLKVYIAWMLTVGVNEMVASECVLVPCVRPGSSKLSLSTIQ